VSERVRRGQNRIADPSATEVVVRAAHQRDQDREEQRELSDEAFRCPILWAQSPVCQGLKIGVPRV